MSDTVDQATIIAFALTSLRDKLATVRGGEVPVVMPESADEVTAAAGESGEAIVVSLYRLAESRLQNAVHQIQRRETDDEGNEFEYLTRPATLLELSVVVAALGADTLARAGLLGEVIRAVKDDPFTPVGGYDWAGNDGAPLLWELSPPGVEVEEGVLAALGLPRNAAVPMRTIVGIDSAVKEGFKRVEERRVTAFKKQ